VLSDEAKGEISKVEPVTSEMANWASVEGEESARRLEGFLTALCEYGDKFDGVLYSKRWQR